MVVTTVAITITSPTGLLQSPLSSPRQYRNIWTQQCLTVLFSSLRTVWPFSRTLYCTLRASSRILASSRRMVFCRKINCKTLTRSRWKKLTKLLVFSFHTLACASWIFFRLCFKFSLDFSSFSTCNEERLESVREDFDDDYSIYPRRPKKNKVKRMRQSPVLYFAVTLLVLPPAVWCSYSSPLTCCRSEFVLLKLSP